MGDRNMFLNIHRRVIGHFEYYEDRVLGKGSNSVVYEGKNIGNGQPVCIKKITIKSPLIQRLVRTEIEVLKRVVHKNILRFVEHFERRAFIYIVTQLCEMTLLEKIKKERGFNEKKALETFLQILEAYQQLRNHGYIHRDIKPENILIARGQIRLADFGYATVLRTQYLRQPFNLGTPLYMSPQTLNSNLYSQKSDIWSLGVTLYEIISGETPFVSKDQLLLKKQIKRPIKELKCHPKLMRLVMKCLQYNSENRYTLQKLYLDAKILLTQLVTSQIQPSRTNYKPQQNQLNYIKFMQYVIRLAEQCPNLNNRLKQRCIYIMEYNIRMRLDLISSLFSDEKMGRNQKSKQPYQKLKQLHSFELKFPLRVAQNDRLNFFKDQQVTFKQSLQWQLQAQLKYLAKQINSQIQQLKTQRICLSNEQKIKLVDFLLTAFVLNQMTIEQENDHEKFANSAKLQLIMNSPCRLSLKTVQKIKAKAVLLKVV